MNVALWTVQGLLAALFLFAGGVKFTIPLDEMEAQSGLPGLLILLVGAAEVLGALGLVLPGLLRVRLSLTPLAASGLVVIMIGATLITLATMDAALALMPLVTGLLAAFVAYGRWRLAPHRGAPRSSALQPTT
jgi:hypothetical protein